LLHFINKDSYNQTGYLTKYLGIISHVSIKEACTYSSFSLLDSTSQLARIKGKVVLHQPSGTTLAIQNEFIDSESFLEAYRQFSHNIYFNFFRDFVVFALLFIFILLTVAKKNLKLIINFLLEKIFKHEGRKNETFYESYDSFVTFEFLENRLKENFSLFENLLTNEISRLSKNTVNNENCSPKLIENGIYLELLNSNSLNKKDIVKILRKKNISADESDLKETLVDTLYQHIKMDIV